MKPKREIPLTSERVKSKLDLSYETFVKLIYEDYLRNLALRRKSRGYPSTSDSTGKSSSKSDSVGNLPQDRLKAWTSQDSFNSNTSRTKVPKGKSASGYQKYEGAETQRGQKAVGGVMTDNSFSIPGQRTIETVTTSGSPPKTTSSTIVQSVTAYQRILDNVVSVDGDGKRPNPHQFRVKRINYGSGRSWAGDNRNYTIINGTQTVGFGLSASFTDRKNFVYNKALSSLYDKIRGDLDLSVDAFQAKQTGVMLNQRFRQGRELFLKKAPFALMEILKITKSLKRANPRDWGSLWLEWTYGWKPLAADIYGASENMILASLRKPGAVTGHPVRSSASEMGDSYSTTVTDGQGVVSTKTVNSVYQARITAFYAVADSRLNSVANYTSLNPVSIAWELVPYSFVADWFVDIGGYLRNLENGLLYGSDFVSGYATERSKQLVTEYKSGGNKDFSVGASGSAETKAFKRSVFSSNPMPRAPGFNPKLGVSRLISAASLLSQQLHSLKHK